jgi:prepilin-type N-terminal cleavage/methylation domain-containing protein/prepilin-type processing-associated H-X9-DG protein
MNSGKRPGRYRCYSGFTLIELLVVISIIALLISILLPSLVGARRTGQRVACMGNLREIASGFTQYGTDNEEALAGAPGGSGVYLMGATTAYGAQVQRWDFMGRFAQMWGFGLHQADGNPADVAQRFDDIRSNKAFLCAANKFMATRFSGPSCGAGWMVSYNTCRMQLWAEGTADETGFPSDGSGLSWYNNSFEEKLPPGYRPSVTRIGVPANKIVCADGARYSDNAQAPDFDLGVQAAWGGAFSDAGAYSTFTKSWDRGRAPGNGDAGNVDARMYAFRHSTAEPPIGAPANAFKMNAAFYDGHVETMGDLEASHPKYWLPNGTLIQGTSSVLWPDAIAQFGLQADVRIGG